MRIDNLNPDEEVSQNTTTDDAAIAVAAGKAGKQLFGREIRINYQESDNKSYWPPRNAVYFE